MYAKKKMGSPSFVAVFIVMLTLIFPHVSFADSKYFTVNNNTSGSHHVGTFTHNNPNAFCTDRPAKFTNYMSARLGTVTNSYIRVNSHSFAPTITSGIVRGGSAFIEHASSPPAQSGTFHNTVLSSGTTYSKTWNFNAPINSKKNYITLRQILYPSNYAPSDHCVENDSFVFQHGSSLLLNDPINSELNSTFNVNSSKVQKVEDNLSLLGFNEIREVDFDEMLLKAFILDNALVEISVHNTSVQIIDDIIDTRTYGNINVFITQNIEGKNVYTLEIHDNDQYIYVRSTIELEDLLTLIE